LTKILFKWFDLHLIQDLNADVLVYTVGYDAQTSGPNDVMPTTYHVLSLTSMTRGPPESP